MPQRFPSLAWSCRRPNLRAAVPASAVRAAAPAPGQEQLSPQESWSCKPSHFAEMSSDQPPKFRVSQAPAFCSFNKFHFALPLRFHPPAFAHDFSGYCIFAALRLRQIGKRALRRAQPLDRLINLRTQMRREPRNQPLQKYQLLALILANKQLPNAARTGDVTADHKDALLIKSVLLPKIRFLTGYV